MSSREDTHSLKLFTDIHGVGPTTARLFLSQVFFSIFIFLIFKFKKGLRTLEDLQTKANLTRQQKIGLKYYEDFKQRIPREEVSKIEKKVKNDRS